MALGKPLLRVFLIQFPNHNCQVGAVGVTKVASGAFFGSHDAWVVFILIHGEDPGRAEFYANAATFAPGGVHNHLGAGTFFGRQHRSMGLA